MSEEKTIYDLELHEAMSTSNNQEAMRVAGGWVYLYHSHGGVNQVFVPYNNEFVPLPALPAPTPTPSWRTK